MSRFADAVKLERHELGLAWLTGLLEAEGTFLKPPPSSPGIPIVACRMTDLDIIERVAAAFGTGVVRIEKGRHKTEYAAVAKGRRAVALMADLRPMLSARRRAATDAALRDCSAPTQKLNWNLAERIRANRRQGESVSSLARRFGTARSTIRAVLAEKIYSAPPSRPWRELAATLPRRCPALPGVSLAELHWLAGWMEGEGSFLAAPPSDPTRPRVSGVSCDRDVIEEVARLLRVSWGGVCDHRRTSRGWSPAYRVLLRGRRAEALMTSLSPILGERRRAQVERALRGQDGIARLHSTEQFHMGAY